MYLFSWGSLKQSHDFKYILKCLSLKFIFLPLSLLVPLLSCRRMIPQVDIRSHHLLHKGPNEFFYYLKKNPGLLTHRANWSLCVPILPTSLMSSPSLSALTKPMQIEKRNGISKKEVEYHLTILQLQIIAFIHLTEFFKHLLYARHFSEHWIPQVNTTVITESHSSWDKQTLNKKFLNRS